MPSAESEPFNLSALCVHLQPIVALEDGSVVGHEALVRGPAGSCWERPAAIAERARAASAERELEQTCRRLALRAAQERVPLDQQLFLNIDLRFADEAPDADTFSVSPSRVAIEVTERQSVLENPQALSAIQRWRQRGFGLVLDDYGTGHSSLASLLALQPDMIKVDRFIISGIDHDARRRAALRRVLELGRDLDVEVLAEGIETQAELHALQDEGVGLGQGYLLGRPGPEPVLSVPTARDDRSTRPQRSAARPGDGQVAAFFGALLDAIPHGAYCVDRRRSILRWNAAATALTGIPAGRVVGRTCMTSGLRHTSPDGLPLCASACPLVRTMADGQPRSGNMWMHTSEGPAKAQVSTTAVRDGSGRIVGAIEVFDIAGDRIAPPRPGPVERTGQTV